MKEMNSYEEKQQRKLERFKELAEKNKIKAKELSQESQKMSEMIPFGQPMMPDHHSYKSDLSFRKRIDNKFKKSIEMNEKAEYYENRVSNIENPTSISSDDPEAVQKLKVKLAKLEAEREEIKKREHKGWELSNIGATIRSVKQRIEYLSSLEKTEFSDFEMNGVKVVFNKEDNRIRLLFPNIPSEEIRTQLKRNGFKWSPYNKAWQRMINNQSIYVTKMILEKVN